MAHHGVFAQQPAESDISGTREGDLAQQPAESDRYGSRDGDLTPGRDGDPNKGSRRPNRTAAARRKQQLRSDTRTLTRLMKGLTSLDEHRGSQLSRIGQDLRQLIANNHGVGGSRSGEGADAQQPAEFHNLTPTYAPVPAEYDIGIERNRFMPVCRHHIRGRCSWGAACRFRHGANEPTAPSSTSAIDFVGKPVPFNQYDDDLADQLHMGGDGFDGLGAPVPFFQTDDEQVDQGEPNTPVQENPKDEVNIVSGDDSAQHARSPSPHAESQQQPRQKVKQMVEKLEGQLDAQRETGFKGQAEETQAPEEIQTPTPTQQPPTTNADVTPQCRQPRFGDADWSSLATAHFTSGTAGTFVDSPTVKTDQHVEAQPHSTGFKGQADETQAPKEQELPTPDLDPGDRDAPEDMELYASFLVLQQWETLQLPISLKRPSQCYEEDCERQGTQIKCFTDLTLEAQWPYVAISLQEVSAYITWRTHTTQYISSSEHQLHEMWNKLAQDTMFSWAPNRFSIGIGLQLIDYHRTMTANSKPELNARVVPIVEPVDTSASSMSCALETESNQLDVVTPGLVTVSADSADSSSAPSSLPSGWTATEHFHGPTAQRPGKRYWRYSTVDGRHTGVGSLRQVHKIIRNNEQLAQWTAGYANRSHSGPIGAPTQTYRVHGKSAESAWKRRA